MIRKIAITLALFVLVCGVAFAVGAAADPAVGFPREITADSLCPVTSCASGSCHGFDTVPEPDGMHEMVCPKATCSSVECHAWDTLVERYHQPSDASLNVWLVAPAVLVVGFVLLVKKMR